MSRTKEVTLGADVEVFLAINNEETTDNAKYADKAITAMYGMDINSDQRTILVGDLIAAKKDRKVASNHTLRKKYLKLIRQNNKIIPCVGLFPGTKTKPHRPKGWGEGYAIQEDNVMLEFNIPATKSASSFYQTMQHVTKLVTLLCKTKDLIPMWDKSEHNFAVADLKSPQAMTFGCDPDLNAYTGGVQRNAPPDFGRLRTCGGHIHIGGDFNCPDFVVVLFLELAFATYYGCSFVVDNTDKRHMWYGQPGTFRTKPYGIEYRTLSNNWANNMSTRDIGKISFSVASLVTLTPAVTVQKWFRSIDWVMFRKLLVDFNPNANEISEKALNKWHEDWGHIAAQAEKIPLHKF